MCFHAFPAKFPEHCEFPLSIWGTFLEKMPICCSARSLNVIDATLLNVCWVSLALKLKTQALVDLKTPPQTPPTCVWNGGTVFSNWYIQNWLNPVSRASAIKSKPIDCTRLQNGRRSRRNTGYISHDIIWKLLLCQMNWSPVSGCLIPSPLQGGTKG